MKAIKGGYKKPFWCQIGVKEKEKEIHWEREGKYSQQREAQKVKLETQGTSRLGSGGKPRFKALFVSKFLMFRMY